MVVAATADLVHTFYADLWNRWDEARVDARPLPHLRVPRLPRYVDHGRAGWRAYRNGVRAGSADFHNEVVSLVVDGDTAAARLLYSAPTPARCSTCPPPAAASSTPARRSSPSTADCSPARGCSATSRVFAVSSTDADAPGG